MPIAKVTWDDLPTVIASESMMVQLFQNLIFNGLKFHGYTVPFFSAQSASSGGGGTIMKRRSRTLEILLVEDNPADVDLILESFAEAGNTAGVHSVRDGEEAMRFLRQEGEHAEAVRPDLILLDLNLPRKDGREVLQEIKCDPALRSLPVIVLTSSQAQKDITTSYDLHANCYITKPLGLSEFYRIARAIEDFWHDVASLPETS